MATKKDKALAGASTKSKNQNHSNRQETQKQIVLKELKKHPKGGVTAWDMITKHRITRTSQYILLLRREGYKIITEREPMENGGHFARYFLREAK